MKKMKSQSPTTTTISLILAGALLLPAFAIPVSAQTPRPIVITFGQPNIWSLEQAHYLLTRMHRQNLDLQTARLGDLDPNATNASRIDILKTLLQAGVSFDEAVGLNNQLLRSDRTFNSQRRQQLLNQRTSLQSESTQLARDIAALRSAKANTSSETEQEQIQSNIDAKTEQKAAVDNQLTQTNEELVGLTSATGEFQSAQVNDSFSSERLSGDLDELINRVQLVNPSIAATLRLDNHVNLQYEIISKQLTLLRDEVGPGERLVFLELPQSINATQDRAENKMAQTWWRIAGYTTVDREWLLQKELERLEAQIKAIDINVGANADLRTTNRNNRTALQRQLEALCERQRQLEVEHYEKEKALEDAKDEKKAVNSALDDATIAKKNADDELEKAKESGNAARIRAAERQLTTAQANLDRAQLRKLATYDQQETLCRRLLHDLEQLTASINEIKKIIEGTRRAISKIDDQEMKLQRDRARLAEAFTSLSTKYEKLKLEKVRDQIRRQQDIADRLIQGGSANTDKVVEDTLNLLQSKSNFRKASVRGRSKELISQTAETPECRKQTKSGRAGDCESRSFINLEEDTEENKRSTEARGSVPAEARLMKRSVRTIDIIPRQNAINVQDTKQSVSKTGIFAAVSFLFGFAGKFTYERQREHAEQFLNQELFTSGFGKGEKDFGWSFYPFAGTRQLSSGVRTTYAVAIIPDDAESIVLKARGCYFPRKENQPVNYEHAGTNVWTDEDDISKKFCTPAEQAFVIPVPGGTGDGADYYVTELRYAPNRSPGERMIASIQGENLPSQVGILINGVPLREAVGLGQLNVESILGNDKTRDNCVGDICGRFERIDSHEIVISFRMPNDFTGTPKIGVIGPGKSIELNKLFLTINGLEDEQLDAAEMMFGDPPDSTLRRIADFRVAPPRAGNPNTVGVLTGSKFKPTDEFHVNGEKATKRPPCRADLCILEFSPQTTDFLTVTISPAAGGERAVGKTFVNPTNLSVISALAISYTPPEGQRDGVMTVKIDGSGFKPELIVNVVGGRANPEKTIPSAGQMFLKIVDPESVVHITITDSSSNRTVNAVVVRPDPPPKEKK
jgi:hypothetical protein